MIKTDLISINNVTKEYSLGEINYKSFIYDFKNIFNKKKILFRSKKALSEINLKISMGEKIAILGNNGSGKSTLLKLISRVTTPTSGEILVRGNVMSLLEVGLGFHPELTGKENIFLNGSILGVNKLDITSKIDSIIKFSELQEFIDTPIKRYSSGMISRLGFTIGIFLGSDILIIDEILAVVDSDFRIKCINKIKELEKENNNLTILFVSHNMELVSKICKRGVVLKEGKIVYDGEIANAISFYQNIRL